MKRYSGALLRDAQGLVFLQQKTADAPRLPGRWCMFGGEIEEGETALDAIQREMIEELELDMPQSAYVHYGDFTFTDVTISVFTTMVPVDTALPLREGRGMGYFTKEEVEHLRMFPNDRTIVLKYLEETTA